MFPQRNGLFPRRNDEGFSATNLALGAWIGVLLGADCLYVAARK